MSWCPTTRHGRRPFDQAVGEIGAGAQELKERRPNRFGILDLQLRGRDTPSNISTRWFRSWPRD
jgi:hypothetical protein